MTRTIFPDAVTIDTASVAPATATAPEQVLHGNEIIELSIKPSLWFVFFVSARTLGAVAAFAAAVVLLSLWHEGLSRPATITLTLCGIAAAARLAFAGFEWASRLYILTNRRVLQFQGVVRVDFRECPLTRISSVELRESVPQRRLRIGCVQTTPCNPRFPGLLWQYVNRPQQVYRKLTRAVREAQAGRGNGA